MPLVDFDDAATWDSLYRCQFDGRDYGFSRVCRTFYLGQDHLILKERLGVQLGESIAIIGGAFGWVAEDWLAAGLGPIAVCDNSRWVHANKAENAVVPILDLDARDPASDAKIAEVLGGPPRWIITEDVMPALSDEEAVALATRLRVSSEGSRVVHWLSVGKRHPVEQQKWFGDSRLNWKMLADWKTLLAPDLVAQKGSADLL